MSPVAVERLFEDGWELLAGIRLRALRTDPDAFGSSLAREEGFREHHWRLRLRSSPWWVAAEPGGAEPVGLVNLMEEPGSPARDRHVTALWVAPTARGNGAGAALLEAATHEARAVGAATLSLWVADAATGAVAFYRRLGFEPTEERHASPARPDAFATRYVRSLGGPDVPV